MNLPLTIQELDEIKNRKNFPNIEEFNKIITQAGTAVALAKKVEKYEEFVRTSEKFGGYAKCIKIINTKDYMEGFWEYFKVWENAFDTLEAIQSARSKEKEGVK